MYSRVTFSVMLNIEELAEFDNHEMVIRIQDEKTGLRGFTVIHSTKLGPAVGGTRYWHYENEEEALKDALRLSKAMSYKCALASVPYGGGKTVLMAPQDALKRESLKNDSYLSSYARRLKLLQQSFFTGEDVGLVKHDIEFLAANTPNIIGQPSIGGLPSYFAALGVFVSMKASLIEVFGNDSFEGRTIAIKGLGNVGFDLAELLCNENATVFGADINLDRIAFAKKHLPTITIVSPEAIQIQKVDVYSPCALGGDLTISTIQKLSCKIVCGSANNQLPSSKEGLALFERGITYVPDYVSNSGGLITVVDELHEGGYNRSRVEQQVSNITETVREILQESKLKNVPTEIIANAVAENKFKLAIQ
jgi:leucine dehydrogenase